MEKKGNFVGILVSPDVLWGRKSFLGNLRTIMEKHDNERSIPSCVSRSISKIVESLFMKKSNRVEEIRQELINLEYESIKKGHKKLFRGVVSALKELKEKKLKIGLLSAIEEVVVKKFLKEFGISEFFDFSISCDHFVSENDGDLEYQEYYLKACEKCLQEAIRKIAGENSQVLLIGTEKDYEISQKVGCFSAIVDRKGHKRSGFRLRQFKDCLELVSCELVASYDSDGRMKGITPRKLIHQSPLHCGTVGFVLNEKGEVLIQKRSSRKRLHAGCWDFSFAEHMQHYECSFNLLESDFKSCAIRGAKEELNVDVKVEEIDEPMLYEDGFEKLMLQVFKVNIVDGPIELRSKEVADVKWIKKKEVLEMIETFLKEEKILKEGGKIEGEPVLLTWWLVKLVQKSEKLKNFLEN